MDILPFSEKYRIQIIDLWHRCGLIRAWNDPHKDIDRKLAVGPELFVIGLIEGEPVASLMGGYDGHRGWMNYLAIAPHHRGQGHAKELVQFLEAELLRLGCPKLNLQIRSDNSAVIDFYRHLGFEPDGAVSMGKRLIADD